MLKRLLNSETGESLDLFRQANTDLQEVLSAGVVDIDLAGEKAVIITEQLSAWRRDPDKKKLCHDANNKAMLLMALVEYQTAKAALAEAQAKGLDVNKAQRQFNEAATILGSDWEAMAASVVQFFGWLVEGFEFYHEPKARQLSGGKVKDFFERLQLTLKNLLVNAVIEVDDSILDEEWKVCEGYLAGLLDNCITNAKEHGRASRVVIKVCKVGGFIEIEVDGVDARQGIKAADARSVFVENFTTKAKPGRPNGLGLAKADVLMKHMRGKAQVLRKGENNRAVFVLAVPNLRAKRAHRGFSSRVLEVVRGPRHV